VACPGEALLAALRRVPSARPREARRAGLRRAPFAWPRWAGRPAAPRSCGFPDPWNRLAGAPKSSGCPAPSRRAARGLRRAPHCGPGVAGGTCPWAGDFWPGSRRETSGLRRGPGFLSRWDGGRRASEEVRVPCPGGMGGVGAPKSSGFPVPVECAIQRPEGCQAPRSARLGPRGSEELRLPYPDGTPPGPPRRSGDVPDGTGCTGAPKSAADPMPGTERTMLEKAPVALSGVAGSPCPFGRGDGCARKRCRCDDAPIRRSGPPRHRAHNAVGGRSSRRCRVKSPRRCQCRSTDAAGDNRTPHESWLALTGRAEVVPFSRPKAAVQCPRPKPRVLRCAAPAPTEVGRRLGPSKPHGAADFKALLR
jgi:hypothetical protein